MKPAVVAPIKPVEEEKPVVVVPPTKKNMLPVMFSSVGSTIEITYLENTGLIKELKFSSGINYKFTYKDNVLFKLQMFSRTELVASADYLITNGQITRVSRIAHRGSVSTPKEKYYLEYNKEGHISKVKTLAVTGAVSSEQDIIYHTDGNLLTSKISKGGSTSNYSYKYDTKNGIFQFVSFCQLLRIEIDEPILNTGINNVTGITMDKVSNENIHYEYVYGADDYPSEVKVKQNDVLKTYKITYVAFK
jgi:hypothetical protein